MVSGDSLTIQRSEEVIIHEINQDSVIQEDFTVSYIPWRHRKPWDFGAGCTTTAGSVSSATHHSTSGDPILY